MGRLFAVSDSRDGPGDGDRQIVAERLGSLWRSFRISYRDNRRIWSVIIFISARCARETKRFLYRSSVLPDHVRAHDPFFRVRGILCMARHESVAALEPSNVQLGTLQPRHQ